MSYNNSFRDSGLPRPVMWASKTGAGTVIAAQTGKHVVIYDILASADTTLKNGSSGASSTYIYMPVGVSNFTGGLKMGEGHEVYSTAGDVTIAYTIA